MMEVAVTVAVVIVVVMVIIVLVEVVVIIVIAAVVQHKNKNYLSKYFLEYVNQSLFNNSYNKIVLLLVAICTTE